MGTTAEDLRRKAEEKRQQVAAQKPADTGSKVSELRPAERTARCPRCQLEWRYAVMERVEGGKVIGCIPALPDVFVCGACQTKAESEDQRRTLEEEERRERDRRGLDVQMLLENLNDAGVNPWEHRSSTFATFDGSECGPAPLERAREFVAETLAAGKYEPVKGLYLCGQTGAGKTHLAVAVVRALLEATYRGRIIFDHSLGLILRIQDTYNTSESAEALIDRRVKAGVWVLDDLGTEKPSDDVVRRLTTIFAERGPRPTIVTSNLTPDQLTDPKRNPEFFRLASRLGPRNFRTVMVKGHDRRFDP